MLNRKLAADIPTVFEVSEVSQTHKPLSEVPYYEAVEALIKKPTSSIKHPISLMWDEVDTSTPPKRTMESCSDYRGRLIADVQFHPLVEAIHKAFNDHRPLCLSPDIVWLLISQGLANHINANTEKLRPKFVKHQGKLTISVRRDDFVKGSPENPWSEVFGEFSALIREHIGDVTHDILVPTFSTTGLVEKAASEVVLLDAMQSYFTYEVYTMCGIPKIKLEGTVTDWQELLDRTKKLAQFELEWWINALVPILEKFIEAAQGKPDKRFWQSIYKIDDMSGGSYITGWITAFFPYVKDWKTGKTTQQNSLLIKSREELQSVLYPFENHNNFIRFEGITTDRFPSGLAKAPFRWQYLETSYQMEFIGGFVGVKQAPNDLFLRPEIGWVVREAANS